MTEDLQQEMDRLYADYEDPWRYGFESRHDVTVGVCQSVWNGNTLIDVGCAEGHLTAKLVRQLNPYPRLVYAYDIAQAAVDRTTAKLAFCRDTRFTRWPFVSVEQADLREGLPDGPRGVSLVVLSDVLTYVPEQAEALVQASFERLAVGGALVMTSWTDSHDYGACFGEPPGDSAIVMEMIWKGTAMNLKHQTYPTQAEYRVLRRLR